MNRLFYRNKKISLCILTALFIYLIVSIMISIQMNYIVTASNSNYEAENTFNSIISDEDFQRLCFRSDRSVEMETNPEMAEKISRTPTITLHWFSGAKSYYWYSYELSDANRIVNASSNIPVTITSKYQNGKWVVTNIFEPA